MDNRRNEPHKDSTRDPSKGEGSKPKIEFPSEREMLKNTLKKFEKTIKFHTRIDKSPEEEEKPESNGFESVEGMPTKELPSSHVSMPGFQTAAGVEPVKDKDPYSPAAPSFPPLLDGVGETVSPVDGFDSFPIPGLPPVIATRPEEKSVPADPFASITPLTNIEPLHKEEAPDIVHKESFVPFSIFPAPSVAAPPSSGTTLPPSVMIPSSSAMAPPTSLMTPPPSAAGLPPLMAVPPSAQIKDESGRELRENIINASAAKGDLLKTVGEASELKGTLENATGKALQVKESLESALNQAGKMREKLQQTSKELTALAGALEKKTEELKSTPFPPAGESAPSQRSEAAQISAHVSESIIIPETSELDAELDDILKLVVHHKGSDLHLKVGSPPIIRIEGELIPVGNQCLTVNDTKRLILKMMTPEMIESLYNKREVDFSHNSSCGRFRVNAFLQKFSVSASFRFVKAQVPSFKQLYLPSALEKVSDFHNGLFIVTGPAGTGKSTTLAAIMDHINENKKLHIITIEDPIEYIFEDKSSIITQREVGIDTESYAAALKMALRQDPNIIMLGELRDADAVNQAIMAAETGHLILSTLHTPNTIQAVRRLLDFFPAGMQKQIQASLAGTLRGIISQRLLRRVDQDGRIPSFEIMFVTPTIASLIRDNNISEIYDYVKDGINEGMITFTESLSRLYKAGFISKEDALYHAESPGELKLSMKKNESSKNEADSQDKSQWWEGRL